MANVCRRFTTTTEGSTNTSEKDIVKEDEAWNWIRKDHFLARADLSNQVYILEFFVWGELF
jgi:hypothetical protein